MKIIRWLPYLFFPLPVQQTFVFVERELLVWDKDKKERTSTLRYMLYGNDIHIETKANESFDYSIFSISKRNEAGYLTKNASKRNEHA